MEYYNGKLCISMRELVDGGIMTIPNYKQLAARKKSISPAAVIEEVAPLW